MDYDRVGVCFHFVRCVCVCAVLQPEWSFHHYVSCATIWGPVAWLQRSLLIYFYFAPFVIVRNWQQPRCSSDAEWIVRMWYICTIKYYSAIMKTEIVKFSGKWIELEMSILSDVTQTQKDKYCIFCLRCECYLLCFMFVYFTRDNLHS